MKNIKKDPLIELLTSNKKTVDARELHRLLEIKEPFEEWMEAQINKLGLVENEDYLKFDNN